MINVSSSIGHIMGEQGCDKTGFWGTELKKGRGREKLALLKWKKQKLVSSTKPALAFTWKSKSHIGLCFFWLPRPRLGELGIWREGLREAGRTCRLT